MLAVLFNTVLLKIAYLRFALKHRPLIVKVASLQFLFQQLQEK